MPKSKNKRKKQVKKRSLKQPVNQNVKSNINIWGKINPVILWLAATGLLAFFSNFIFSYFTGDIEVKYIKPVGRGYEFQLTNKSSTDQKIEYLRATPDQQEFVFKITEKVYGNFSADGRSVSIPGGNESYMLAYEYKGMDGYVIPAKSTINFKLPPLSSRDYVTPESVVMYLDYKTSSSNSFINKLEKAIEFTGLGAGNKKLKYLVSENYWTPISNESVIDATKEACRDDDSFGKSSVCDKYN
ncbi:hypothetical protein LQN35_004808 [Vibrio parahaemolyticus]|nr:hypothetical protein [Vibrio parahaemolyticus]MDF4490117.1 hypothetical protein [Vibrio parahaemolyticus]MDG3384628.1 hypothetical protein [Vibrio parahaemolyticus]